MCVYTERQCGRSQQVFATSIGTTLNLTGIFQSGHTYFVQLSLFYGDITIYRNVTMTQAVMTLNFDLTQYANKRITGYKAVGHTSMRCGDYGGDRNYVPVYTPEPGVVVYDGANPDACSSVPMLQVFVFNTNPVLIPKGDIVSLMTNLVTYDYTYLKITYDMTYWNAYWAKAQAAGAKDLWARALQFLLGLCLVIGAVLATACTGGGGLAVGLPMAVFGIDNMYQL